MVGLTLDSGALIALEKHDRAVFILLKAAAETNAAVTVPAGVLAQAWRGNSPMVARLLHGAVVENMTEFEAKTIGVALASSKTTDVVDASVVVSALRRGDVIATSDPGDIRRVADGLQKKVKLFPL